MMGTSVPQEAHRRAVATSFGPQRCGGVRGRGQVRRMPWAAWVTAAVLCLPPACGATPMPRSGPTLVSSHDKTKTDQRPRGAGFPRTKRADGTVADGPDSDGDRIPDFFDCCPQERENYNGCRDRDGCPDRADACHGVVRPWPAVVAPQTGGSPPPRRQLRKKGLPPDAQIATPRGAVAIHELRLGMPVFTRDKTGRKTVGTVRQLACFGVERDHEVVEMSLADGRAVVASVGHPGIDGTGLGRLRPKMAYDGSEIVRVTTRTYGKPTTMDLLPSGPTGVYWAAGVPLRSTLSER